MASADDASPFQTTNTREAERFPARLPPARAFPTCSRVNQLAPTAPEPAFKIGMDEKDPVVSYLHDIFTVQASLAGVPAISLPVGNNSGGLPLGLQFLTKAFGERDLLEFSEYFLNLNKIK